MQTSGFATLANVLASLAVPFQIPVLMMISERGTLGEFQVGQAIVCRTMRPVLNTLGIETFLAVVRAQSLSRAAEELHLAQTTISQRIKVLEQEMGLTLIERGKGIKAIRLTLAGEEFLKLAERWSFIWREAQLLQANGPRFSLVVGSVDSINTFVLPPVFRALNQRPVPLKLQVHTSHSAELYFEVEKRQVDVAFVLRNLIHPNVNVMKCFTSPMVVLRLAKSPEKDKAPVHPEELNPDRELFMPWGREYQVWHEYWWSPLNPSRISLDSANLLFGLLQEEDQWAIVPKVVALAAAQRGSYSIDYLADPPPNYTCYKLTHKNSTSLTAQALEIFDQYFQTLVCNLQS